MTRSAPNKSRTPMIISCDNFDIRKFSTIPLDLNSKINTSATNIQLLTFPRYEFSPGTKLLPTIKTGPIQITSHGIRRYNAAFMKSEEDRETFRIPFDETQEECVKLFKLFEQIDEYAIKNKLEILGPLAKQEKIFKYSPIIRTRQVDNDDDDDDDDSGKKKSNFNASLKFANVRFNIKFDTKKFDTHVFTRENGIPQRCDVKTITDLANNYFTFKSTCQFILECNKVWYSKNKKEGFKSYGFGFKCPQLEIVEKSSFESTKQSFNSYAFSSNEEEFDEEELVENKKNNGKKNVEESDSEDEEDTKTKNKNTGKKKANDSDSEDEEDTKAKNKKQSPVKKKVVDSDSESDSESDSDSDSD